MRLLFPFILVALMFGCGESGTTGTGGTGGTVNGCDDSLTFEADPPLELNTERPADVHIPDPYDPAGCYPLVILLHGFGANGASQDLLFGTKRAVNEKQYVLITPDGTLNDNDQRFWNATAACCAFGEEVDDVGYVSSLIEDAKDTYNIDHDRVYLFGHSNGGFMSYRMACETPELITGIASLAGSTFNEPADCTPEEAVSVLQIHGTDDQTISYDGEEDAYPGAVETTERHAALNGCDPAVATPGADRLDLVLNLPGNDTDVVTYGSGCDADSLAELWTIQDGPHVPAPPTEQFTPLVLDWLFARSK